MNVWLVFFPPEQGVLASLQSFSAVATTLRLWSLCLARWANRIGEGCLERQRYVFQISQLELKIVRGIPMLPSQLQTPA